MAIKVDYVARETFSNLKRNALMTAAAILTVAVSLALVGSALLVRQAVSRATTQWKGGVELSIFMNPAATPDEIATVDRQVHDMPEVKKVTYVDHKAAYEEFIKIFRDSPEFKESIQTPDQLPPSFRVVPQKAELVDAVGQRFVNSAGVRQVVYARDTIKTILKVTRFVTTFLWIVALVALMAASLLILNTIQLAIFARRREVGVMKLVGATNWFIRVPFMMEGLIQGLIGAAAAVGLMIGLRPFVQGQLKHIQLLQQFFVTTSQVLGTGVVLLVLGSVIGAAGSAVAVTRFLDV
jgi:cell division transport system permease protein